jgi:hypothetical protein
MALIDQLIVNKNLPMDDDYKEDMAEIAYLRLSYEGGNDYCRGVDGEGDTIIHRMECEEKADFKLRQKRTPYRSYVSSIINKYNSAVFRNEPARTTDAPAYDVIYMDADSYNTPLNELMRKALLRAQVDGHSFLMAASTAADTEVLTIAQKMASDARPYVRLIPAESVAAYEEVEDKLIEAIVMLVDETGKTFARYMNDEVFIDIQLNKNKIDSMSEPYAHGYAAIPLVEIEPFEEPQAAPIADGQRNIVNILSLLSQELGDSVFTKHILSGVRIDPEQENQKVQWSGKRLVVLEDANAKLEQIGADHGCADSLRKEIDLEEKNLYYTAGLGKPNVEPTNLSGLSRLIALEDFFIYAQALTRAIESAENYILGVIASKEGFEYTPAAYVRKYITDDAGDELQKLRDLLALDMPATFKKLAIKDYIERFYNLNDEQKKAIESELNADTTGTN